MNYLDSLRPHKSIARFTPYLMKQHRVLFSNYIDADNKLAIGIKPTTPQQNSLDCGIFAAAYAAVYGADADLQAPYIQKCVHTWKNACQRSAWKHFPGQQSGLDVGVKVIRRPMLLGDSDAK